MSDPVNHPSHYTQGNARCDCGALIECIQVTEGFDFCTGNAIKYLWRHADKGRPVEDLRKAVWYIQRRIAQLEAMPTRDKGPISLVNAGEPVYEGDEIPGPPACVGGGCGED